MPSNWLAMDDNFPTFTGEESPQQQIAALHNYLYQMREGLQYSMRNLTAENFNGAALQQLTDDQKNSVAEELRKLQSTINGFSNEISALSARVSSVENLGARMNDAESVISYLEKDVAELQENQEDLEGQLTTAQTDIDGLQEIVSGVMQTDENGDATLGREGKKMYLVGEIYINGKLYESGGEAT